MKADASTRCAMTLVLLLASAATAQCELDKIFADDGEAFEQFGDAVAISSDWIVCGSDFSGAGNEGAAYVFERIGLEWVQSQKLIGSDTAVNDHFGNAVAMDGDTLMVGAYLADGPPFDQGAVYVFENIGGVLVEQQKLVSPNPEFQGQFGYAVDIDANRAVISEIWANHEGQFASGIAYEYERSGGMWQYVTVIDSPDPEPFDQFGINLDLDGNRIIVAENVGQGQDAIGRTRMFQKNGDEWDQIDTFDAEPGTGLGVGLGLTGDHALVGAPLADGGIGIFAGAVYHIRRDQNGEWNFVGQLIPEGLAATNQFGASIAIDANLAVIGSPEFGTPGAAYLYRLVGDDWFEVAKLTPSDGNGGVAYGFSAALDPPLGVVGAFSGDGVVENSGSAYIFETLSLDPNFVLDNFTSVIQGSVQIGNETHEDTAHATGSILARLTEGCNDEYATFQIISLDVSTIEGMFEFDIPGLSVNIVDPAMHLGPGLGTPPSPAPIDATVIDQSDGEYALSGMLEYEIFGIPAKLDLAEINSLSIPMTVTLGEGGTLTGTFDIDTAFEVDLGLGPLNPMITLDGPMNGEADLGGCFPDCDDNGMLNILDFVCYQALFVAGDPAADCDGDGMLNILDFVCFQGAFQAGCP